MAFYAPTKSDITPSEIKHTNLLRENASECVVLLENNGALPVDKYTKIALYGNGAKYTVKGGTGSGDVNTRFVVSIYDGLVAAGYKVTSTSWLNKYDDLRAKYTEEYLAFIKAEAKRRNVPDAMALFDNPFVGPELPMITDEDVKEADTDTAFFVISRDSGEGKDRTCTKGDYLLTDEEEACLRTLAEKFDKTIVLINAGGIIDTSVIKSIDGIDAILCVSQLGHTGGHSIADVISGQKVPSGKLTDTWAKKYEDYPGYEDFSSNNGNNDDEYYKEGIYIGYRYFDSFGIEPQYPFGYGLSYTTFEMKTIASKLEGKKLSLKIQVANTGKKYSGKEVIQVYYSAPKGEIDKPYQELIAYKKTGVIAPGEFENVIVELDVDKMTSYDVKSASRVLEAGEYLIRVGNDSRNTVVGAVINVPERIVVEKLKTLFEDSVDFEVMKNPGKGYEINAARDEAQKNAAAKYELDVSSVETKVARYQGVRQEYKDQRPEEVVTLKQVLSNKALLSEVVAQLTVDEMVKLCVGDFSHEYIEDNVIGSASASVPGAAAETTSIMSKTRSIPSLVFADGPAGLRLQPHFKGDSKGRLLKGGEIFGLSVNPFPENLPDDAIDYYQYCTAIPIATALAQSWNENLIAEMGRVVGEEMIRFNVHLWLAPGMNIHRNPLCGRNFEYYSEDPLVSGKCAAADTKGVQSCKGRGTTIKHFAGNNQEDNRMFSNSHIPERALRDLYLKGFEIAVKESQPLALMTSYNLLNGTHTANNHDLIQRVLRDEWGFEGAVMTDWYTTQDATFLGESSEVYPSSDAYKCIYAGNDWIMPGGPSDVKSIVTALEGDKLTLADLQFCAANILRICLKIME